MAWESSLTLSTLRDRVELALQDSTNTTWATGDIDEAITTALDQYTNASPAAAISSETLSSDGRQIDLTSYDTLIAVLRVWWDYDSADPDHPPKWRDFELWPNSILFINDPEEPKSGDVVHFWWTKRHTLNGLRGSAATTFPGSADSLMVTGAAGYAALQRSIEIAGDLSVDGWVHKRLRDWGEAMVDKFETALADISAKDAARWSGIATGPDLDRWDSEASDWW